MAGDVLTHEVLDPGEPGNTLGDYYHLILSNLGVILSVTLVVMLASILYYSMKPNLYTASVQILVEKTGANTKSNQQDVLTPGTTPFRGEDDYYGTQIAILTGRQIAHKVTAALPALESSYKIQATRIKSTRILQLSITYKDPALAAQIANKFAEVFVQDNASESLFIGQQILKFIPNASELSGQTQETGQTPGAEGEPATASLAGETSAETPGENQGFSKKEFVESFAGVMGDLVVQKMRVEKLEIEAKLQELSQRYRPQHPVIRELTDRLNYVNSEINNRTKTIVTNLRAGLAGQIKINNVKVLEEAVPPTQPSEPKRVRGVMLFTFMGLFGSIWLVLTFEMLNDKVRSEKDLAAFTRVPFLGYIPLSKELAKNKKGHSAFFSRNTSLVEIIKKSGVLTDAVANVRTHILFSMPYEKSKRIMLTSAVPAEGKSTVATLLSLSLITLGRKILLVDADMRRPSLHNYLSLPNDKGLSDYLVGNTGFDEIVRPVPGGDLKIITAGSKTPNPSELLASDRFRELLDTASEQFDRVVLDVPPVLFIADGLVVAKHIHSGVLVCGSGMVHRRTVQAVIEKFASVGHAFIGIVINHADYEKEGYRYRYYKNYKNYYAGHRKTVEARG